MKIRLKYIAVCICVFGAIAAYGERLSPEQAFQRAMADSQGAVRAPGLGDKYSPVLVYSVSDSVTETPAVYVFANGGNGGFWVVSADDSAIPLLGYSDRSSFDKSDIPPAMKEWLNGYALEIASSVSDGPVKIALTSEPTDHQPIEPMVTTRWNQSAPFNDRCPMLYNRRSVTGCLATAEAQILNYHKYPEAGSGVVSYNWKTGGRNITVDLDTVPLRWADMADVYNESSNPQSKLAVADLMYACGVVSSMDYSPSSSGATSLAGAQGMYGYMGCSEAAVVLRSWFNPDDWDQYVYNYLAEKGPLLYCGQSAAGGHAFVCDGYMSDGYYHFNWGWGGMSDGYFQLSALNPGSQGIGGSSSGYNSNQQLLTGLYEPGSKGDFVPMIVADGGVFVDPDFNGVKGDTILLESNVEKGGFFNYSMATVDVTYGARLLRNSTGDETFVPCYGIQNVNLEGLRGWLRYPVVIPDDLQDGTYTLTPAFNAFSNGWHEMPILQSVDNYVLMTVSGDSIKFERPQPAPIKISDIEFETPLYSGAGFKLKASVTATSDRKFYGNIAMLLGESYGEDFVADFQGEVMLLGAKPAVDTEFVYSAELGNKRLKGDYTLVFVNTDNYQIVSDPITVNVKPYVQAAYTVSDARIVNESSVDPNDVRVSFKLECTAGFFSQRITLAVGQMGEDDTFSMISRFESPVIYVENGESVITDFGGGFAGAAGQVYAARLEIYNPSTRKYEPLSDYMTFTVAGASGVDEASFGATVLVITPNPVEAYATVTAPDEITEILAFDMSWGSIKVNADIDGCSATIDVSSLSSGVYILQVSTTNGVTIAKMVKR